MEHNHGKTNINRVSSCVFLPWSICILREHPYVAVSGVRNSVCAGDIYWKEKKQQSAVIEKPENNVNVADIVILKTKVYETAL
jgi:hypothetical protein